jgi:hypothetical protein
MRDKLEAAIAKRMKSARRGLASLPGMSKTAKPKRKSAAKTRKTTARKATTRKAGGRKTTARSTKTARSSATRGVKRKTARATARKRA